MDSLTACDSMMPNAPDENKPTNRPLSDPKTLSCSLACACFSQQSNAPPSAGVARMSDKYAVADGFAPCTSIDIPPASKSLFKVPSMTSRARAGDAAATAPNTRLAVAATSLPLAASSPPSEPPHPPPQHPASVVSIAHASFERSLERRRNVDSASTMHASDNAARASAAPPNSLANIVVITDMGVVARASASSSKLVAFGCARAARMVFHIVSKYGSMTRAPHCSPMARTARAASAIFPGPNSGFKLSSACDTAHGANVGDAHIARSTASASCRLEILIESPLGGLKLTGK